MGKQRSLSGFERSEFSDDAEISFSEMLEESPLGINVVLYQNGNLDEDTAIHTLAVVQGNSSNSPQAYDMRQILSRRGTLRVGNYVRYQNSYWLIFEIPGDNQFYEKAVIRQCNYLLRWVNPQGTIVERHSHFREGFQNLSGTTGLDANKYLITPNARSILFLPKDSETDKIYRNQRFIIDDYNNRISRKSVTRFLTKGQTAPQCHVEEGQFR